MRHLAGSLARKIAAPWPERQYSNGRFYDPIGGHSAYGEAVLGYALIDEGIRDHDRRAVGTGLRALRFATDRVSSHNGATSVFQNMAVGLAYKLAQERLRNDSRWTAIRPIVERFMRRQVLVHLRPNNPLFGNHLLVEALEVFTFAPSGVHSSAPRAIVGPKRSHNFHFTRDFIRRGVPRLFAHSIVRSGGDNTLLLSDPPDAPLAYLGLSMGLYARAIDALGDDAGSAAGTLRRSLEATWRLMGPDGDMAYSGRQLQEAWALTAAAYGAREAEGVPGTSATRAARYDGLALRALRRVRDVHLGGPAGILIVPALRADFDRSRLAAGHGAGEAPYGGLALMFLNLIADGPARGTAPSELRSDSDGASVLGSGQSLLATQRIGRLWMAVRGRPSVARATDIRYDGGLIAAKRRRADGSWADLIPSRPVLHLRGIDSAGPLLHSGGGTAVFRADRVERRGRDGLAAIGGYGDLHGSPGLHRPAYEDFRPVGCGVEVSFPLRGGDRAEYSVFLRDEHRRVGTGVVRSGGTTVTFSPHGFVEAQPDWISASDARVVRVRAHWHPSSPGRVRVKICGTAEHP